MALTRKFLKALGIDDEKMDEIISAHTETVEALKQQRDDAQKEAAKLTALTKERDDLKNQVETLTKAGGDAAKVQADFDAYKKQVESREQEAKTVADVQDICKTAGVTRDSFLRLVSSSFDRSKIERDKDGNITNRDKLLEYVKSDFADCVASTAPAGVPPTNPPAPSGKPKTREDVYKKDDKGRYVYDSAQRQQALAEIMATET